VRTGLDVLQSAGFAPLKGRRVGVLAHASSVNVDLVHITDLLIEAGVDLRVRMGPEHGIGGAAQDMEPVESEEAPSVPAISLYGQSEENLRPPRDVLDDIDVLVADLQDVGSRYYTYAATLRYCMEDCAQAGVTVMVLDRPNPINGMSMEGPLIQAGLRSFVGAYRVPVRHGLTIGELAIMAKLEGVDADVQVIKMDGWLRDMWYDQTGLNWLMPSPNMPTLDTATVYPGACLLEATNLSEGRGTARPFELLGAPWLRAKALCLELSQSQIPGASFRPLIFRPTFQKHVGENCHGIQTHVTDRSVLSPFQVGLLFLQAARRQNPEKFAWRSDSYEFVTDYPAIDLLTGSGKVRDIIENDGDAADLRSSWQADLANFAEERKRYLLYPEVDQCKSPS
jgi:uncharacterized protein YbbC (DUF1343 family)